MARTKLDNSGYAKVSMHIVEFTTKRIHFGRRGHPEIPIGTKLYAIAYGIGGYNTYSYIEQSDAQKCIDTMITYDTDNMRYYPFNVVKQLDDTMHVFPKRVKV